ncbi:MAG TPA: hypothetical protein VGK97_08855 [Spongiibacteraceae bacterium]|jgi:hypothetical protein
MRKINFLIVSITALAGCAVTVPTGPSVAVMPAAGKPFEVFQNDNAVCMQYAREQIGVDPQRAGQSEIAAGAATGAVLGAAAGAALGDSSRAAGAGAGAGLLMGTAIGAGNADRSSSALQRRYDIAYQQCMYAKGNQLPQPDYSHYREMIYPTYSPSPPRISYPPPLPPPPPPPR